MSLAHGVAIMESPQYRSTRFDAMISDPNLESGLSRIGIIHNAHHEKDGYGSDNDDDGYFVVANRHLLKSPIPSLVPTAASTTCAQRQKYRVLGTMSLVGVCFMATVGGPVGSEPLISTGGPLVGLIGIATYFLLCQIPIALMITELSCAFPENGGFSVWVMAAFGPFWGFQVGYWAWLASVVNNAFYPGLIYFTITQALGVQPSSGFVVYLFKVAIALLLALPSYIGVRFIGVASLIMMTLVAITTLVFCVWGVSVGDGAMFRLSETRTLDGSSSTNDNVAWIRFISFLFTNFDRLQWISMVAGEVRNPARTYPRVILITVPLAAVIYLLPFITTVIGDKMPWRDMTPSTYPVIANALGGSVLHSIMVFSSIVTYIGLYANSVFLQSFLIQGMAQSRLLPRFFRKRSKRFKTPKYAVLADILTSMVVLALPYDTLLDMTNSFSSGVQIMIVLSLLQLRRAFPNLHRPMRMPGNAVTIVLLLLPACAVFLFIIGSTLVADWTIGRLVIAFLVPGLFIPFIRKRVAGVRLCG